MCISRCVALLAAVLIVLSSIAYGGMSTLVENSSYYTTMPPNNAEWVAPSTRRVDYPPEGVTLGQGWDSLRDVKTQGQCIQFSVEEAGGQTAQVHTKRIFESDSLRRELGLSYSAAAKAKFGVGGGGASVKSTFLSSSEVNRQFLNLLVKGEVQNGVSFASPSKTPHGVIEFTDYAEKLLGPDRSEFIKYCGDSFVAAIERGAELYALYQFSSEEKKNKQEKSTSIAASGSYMGFSGSASTSTKSTREAVTKNELSGLKYFHSAHRGLRLPYNEESINAALASLGNAPEPSDAQPYRLQLVRYDSLPGWSGERLFNGPATRETLVAAYYRLSDLRDTAIDLERNPQNYSLDYAQEVKSRGILRDLFDQRLTELGNLLEKCETDKEGKLDVAERMKIVEECTTRANDIVFTDYPYRVLMPIENTHKRTVYTTPRKDELTKSISSLKNKYANTTVKVWKVRIPCPQAPQSDTCRSIQNQIRAQENELNLFLAENSFRDVAQSRYLFWIEEIAQAREEDGLVNGALTPSELAMYRREIFCQYGKTPDSVRCPENSLTEMLIKGHVIKQVKEDELDLQGETKNNPTDAWTSLQEKIAAHVDGSVGAVPHYFELLNPDFEEVKTDDQKSTAFRVKSKVAITYFVQDDATDAEIKKLLMLP